MYQEANWIDPDTGAMPTAGAVDPNVDLNKALNIWNGTPGGGSGAGAHLRMGSGKLTVSHATLRMSPTVFAGIYLGGSGSTITMNEAKVFVEFINGGNVTMGGHSELTLYNGSAPLTNSVIDLQSSDCFVFFLNRRPADISGTYLTHFTVNGAAAVLDGNVFIREYYNGAVIRPKKTGSIGLRAFELPDLQGTQSSYAPGFYGAEGTGSATRTATKYTVLGWGGDIGGTTDECYFVYRAMSGDAEIVAHVDSVEDTGTSAKGGLMIRASLARNAAFALSSQRPDNVAAFHSRAGTGLSAVQQATGGGTTSAKYLRLVRVGNLFTSYYSTTAATGPWTQLGTAQTIVMPVTVYVGLAVTSGDGANACTSAFTETLVSQAGIPVGSSTFGVFDAQQDVYSYWAKEDLIRSFLLKKGYQVTLAEDAAGQGYSKVYVATDSDLAVNLPAELDGKVSFMRMLPWRWIAKKGWGGANSPNPFPTTIGAYWNYEWEPTGSSSINREFVPMIKGRTQNADYRWEEVRVRADQTHFLGFNEPMNANQGDLTVDEAIALWPKALKLGLRLGSPSRTDGAAGDAWLQDFMAKAATNGYRVDYVCVHNYKKTTAASLQTWLQAEYNKYQRPIWLTEFNRDNDASTTAAQHQAYLAEVLPMLEGLSFVERYAYYNYGGNNMTLFNGDGTTNALGDIYATVFSNPAYVNPTVAPWCSVALTSPANNLVMLEGSNTLATATASIASTAISSVEFFANDTPLGTDGTAPYQVSLSSLPPGRHTVYATITAAFGETATSTPRLVTVTANTAPTVTNIADQSIAVNTATAALPFTINDSNTVASALMLAKASSNPALVPTTNIVVGGSGASRTVTVTPVANQLGSSTITVTVSDGTLTASDTFLVTVTGTAIETWRFANFGTTANTGNAADTFDANNDGEANLLEYATAQNPNAASLVALSAIRTASAVEITYTRSKAALTGGVTFTVEWSDTLGTNSWSAAGVTQAVLTDNGIVQTVKATIPTAGTISSRYLRLKVTQNAP